jgi:hypothetical protein
MTVKIVSEKLIGRTHTGTTVSDVYEYVVAHEGGTSTVTATPETLYEVIQIILERNGK